MELNVVIFASGSQLTANPAGHLGYMEGQQFVHIKRHPGTPDALRTHRAEAQDADVVVLGPSTGLLGRDTDRSRALWSSYHKAIDKEEVKLCRRIAEQIEKEDIGSDAPLSGHLSAGSLLNSGQGKMRLILVVVPQDDLAHHLNFQIPRSLFQLSAKPGEVSRLLRDVPPIKHPSLSNWLAPRKARFRRSESDFPYPKLPDIRPLSAEYLPHPSGQDYGIEIQATKNCCIVIVPETGFWQGDGGSLASIIGNFLEVRFPDTFRYGWDMVKGAMHRTPQSPIGASALWRLACIQIYQAARRQPLGGQSRARRPHIMIVGSSGSGKEHLGKLAHDLSMPAKHTDFTPVNCAALTGKLTEGQLFGAEKGSHSTAFSESKGLVEDVNDGTLFLDEFQEFVNAPEAANHLLRFLETGTYHRVGGTVLLETSAWVVAATNSLDLLDSRHFMYKTGLLFRFRSMIRVPNLLERWSDVPLLVRHMVEQQFQDEPEQIESICTAVIGGLDLNQVKASGVRSIIRAVGAFEDQRQFASEVAQWKINKTNFVRNKKGGLSDSDLVDLLKTLCDPGDSDRQEARSQLTYGSRESLRKRISKIQSNANKTMCKQFLDELFPDGRTQKGRKAKH